MNDFSNENKGGARRTFLIAAALCAGIAFVFYFGLRGGGSGSSGMPSGGKRYGKVKRGDLIQKVSVSGLVRPNRRTIFVAPYSGYVRKIYVSVGEKVSAGDPVISVVSSLMSPEPVFPIRAPFSGTVVDVPKSEGEYVSEKDAKDVMVRIDDLSHFFVVAKAPELDAAKIQVGMDVQIRVSAVKEGVFKGAVRSVDLAAQEADGWKQQQATFDVKVDIQNPSQDIRSGQSAILDIVTAKYPNVLYLEHEFINQEGDKYFVITRRGDKVPVELGHQADTAAEIVKGLDEGTEVEQIDFLKLLESGA